MNSTNSTFTIIPAIDLLDGKVVRLRQGDYDVVTHYELSPEAVAKKYLDAGATRIHIVDLDAAKSGVRKNETIVKNLRKTFPNVEFEIGGGIRNISDAAHYLDMGFEYIILGSLIIDQPVESKKITLAYPRRVLAGIDAFGKKIATHGWTDAPTDNLDAVLRDLSSWPLAAIIYTDTHQDGMLSGPNFEMLAHVASLSTHPIIASGGVATLDDIQKLKGLSTQNISGCIVGKAILDQKINLSSLWP